ncbi:MAG: hypothetical protein OXC60_11260 [Litoreibacter sp.]|nr:hypothetical protein [Litoreibacter sp.]
MLLKIIKSFLTAISLTMLGLTAVYTIQARETRAAVPTQIGQRATERPFLLDFIDTRQELLLGYFRENYPQLNLPPPKQTAEKADNPLSLRALHERAHNDRVRAAQRARQ